MPLLDVVRRWDRELSEDEQRALAFARVLLQAPAWVLIDEVFDSLDGDTLERVIEVFGEGARAHRRHSYRRRAGARSACSPAWCI